MLVLLQLPPFPRPQQLVSVLAGLAAQLELSALLPGVVQFVFCRQVWIHTSQAGRGIAEHGTVRVPLERARTSPLGSVSEMTDVGTNSCS